MKIKRMILSIALLIAASPLATCQTVKAPEIVKVKPGSRAEQIIIESSEPNVDYEVVGVGIDVFREFPPPNAKPNSMYLRVSAPSDVKAGSQFWIFAVNAKDSKVGKGLTLVQVEGVGPKPPDPGPGPGPGPGPDPTPTDDLAKVIFPGVQGLHVLMVFDRNKGIPLSQHEAAFAANTTSFLEQNCPLAPDGKTKAYRRWDFRDEGSADSVLFAAAIRRANEKKTTLPWIVLSNGRQAHEGPLPANQGEMMTLLQKYAK